MNNFRWKLKVLKLNLKEKLKQWVGKKFGFFEDIEYAREQGYNDGRKDEFKALTFLDNDLMYKQSVVTKYCLVIPPEIQQGHVSPIQLKYLKALLANQAEIMIGQIIRGEIK